MSIAEEKYVAFTTFTKDGTPKSSPVWIAALDDGRLGFTTASSSWKIKRLRNDSTIRLQPSDAKGNAKPGSAEISGTAVAVAGSEFEAVLGQIASKYGYQYHIVRLIGAVAKLLKRGSGTDTAVLITLDQPL